MGIGPFWVGFAGAMKEDRIRTEDTEKEDRRIGEQRAYQEAQSEKDRKFQMDKFMTGIAEGRRDTLLSLAQKQAAAGALTDDQRRSQIAVTRLIGGVEGSEELLAAAMADPALAESIMGRYNDAAKQADDNTVARPTGADVVRSFESFGIDATPGDILDYSQVMADLLQGPMTPERYAEVSGQLASGRGATYVLHENDPLFMKPGDELWARQTTAFDARVKELVGGYQQELAQSDDPAAAKEFADAKAREAISGVSAYYGLFGQQVADEMGDYSLFRFKEQNPTIGRFFQEVKPDTTTEAIPTETSTPTEDFSTETSTPMAFDEAPAQPPIGMTIPPVSDMLVVPKSIDVGGRMVDISKMQEVNPELIIEAGAVPYEDWRGMSREERRKAGLPVSEIGGQIRYANRDGGYDILNKGWDVVTGLLENEQGMPDGGTKGYEGDTPAFTDSASASAADQIRLALKLGRVNYGDTVIVNGKTMKIKESK